MIGRVARSPAHWGGGLAVTPADSDTDLAAMVARLSMLLQDAQTQAPSQGWLLVVNFFAERGDKLPRSIREEFLAMQTGLFAATPESAPSPLEPAEKLERLQKIIWRWRASKTSRTS